MLRRRRIPSWAAAAVAGFAPALPALAVEALAVRAEPASLVLGAGARATVSLVAPCEAPPRVSANVGRVGAVRALGGGRFELDYAPPETAYPQVAIVAVASCDRWGWVPIPLTGRGVAVARASPHSEIRVTIGGASFGPARADASGEAKVAVVVPAGVDRAYHRDRPLDLKIPPTLHLHVALGRDAAPADVDQEVPLRVFAVTPAGAPRAAAPVLLEVTRGVVEGLAEIAPGELAATWRVPSGAAGTATVKARLADEPGLASAASLERRAGAPARVSLEADRVRAVAGADPPIALRASVTDGAGNPSEEAPRFEAALGAVSPPSRVGPGVWEASLALPAVVRKAVRTEVVARAAGIAGRVGIDVAPPAPPEERARRVSATPKLGLAASRGGLAAAYLGAEGAWQPALLGDRLSFALEVGGFVRERTDEVTVGAQSLAVEGRARYVPVLASLRLHRAAGSRQAVWFGAGPGVAHVASDVSVEAGPVTSESGVVPVLHASAAWGLRAGRATPFAEARLAWHGDPGFDALRGSLTTLTFLLGCRYDVR